MPAGKGLSLLRLSQNSPRTLLTKKPTSIFSIGRVLIFVEGVLMVFFEFFWNGFRVLRQSLPRGPIIPLVTQSPTFPTHPKIHQSRNPPSSPCAQPRLPLPSAA